MSAKIKDPVGAMCRLKTRRAQKSKPDTERDSGFSDASSEHMSVVDQTDSEDAGRAVVPGSRSKPPQLSVIAGSLPNLSPMIIMNNVLLKQPGDGSSSLKRWGFGPALEVVRQPQVVFLQPVLSQRRPPESKAPLGKRRRHKRGLPEAKSYPKIAPHPGDSPHSVSSSSSGTTASVSGADFSSTCRECPQPRAPPPAGPGPVRLGPVLGPSDTQGPRAPPRDGVCDDGGSGCSRRKRFCNTYDVLSKSGLLDITLRTKDLIRQNRRTQAQIDALREHTRLLADALRDGDLHVWSQLQLSVQEEREKDKTFNSGPEST